MEYVWAWVVVRRKNGHGDEELDAGGKDYKDNDEDKGDREYGDVHEIGASCERHIQPQSARKETSPIRNDHVVQYIQVGPQGFETRVAQSEIPFFSKGLTTNANDKPSKHA